MKEKTRAKDIFDLVNVFLSEHSKTWNKVGLVCMNGALDMIGASIQFRCPNEVSCSTYNIKQL